MRPPGIDHRPARHPGLPPAPPAPTLGSYLAALLDRLPSQCAVCRAWPSQTICNDCASEFARPVPRCLCCALPVATGTLQCEACTRRPPPLDACLAGVSYEWPWPDCIAKFKFQGDAAWAGPFATLMLSVPWVEPAIERADLVLPVPLAPGRLRERGFNQAHELARRLAPRKADPTLLLRVRETSAQSSLPRAQRLQNLRGAFAVEPMRAAAVRGRRVVLVDDVMTSGASIFAAAQVLRDAGAAHVTAVVLARTPAPGDAG